MINRAAHAVVLEWPGVIDADDLAQELWVQVWESQATRTLLEGKPARERMNLLCRMGHRIAAGYRSDNARFSAQVRYSVDDIKDALSGRSLWSEITEDIALGMKGLRERNDRYADAIERYVRKVPPETEADRKRRDRAIEALADETNAAVRQLFDGFEARPGRTLGDGPGSKRRAFPQDVNNSKNIFDPEFNGSPRLDMYRSWVDPEMYPDERPARIENWDTYSRADFR
ncbi:hypothetical protein [Nocardia terpenica]|uniref:hypothetical protein n=1 Tax=Nocardia terpenica TaxID=455432 RepID=UPI001E633816|nr:hypothetical protein [Nocardia terpenica]